MKSTNSNFTSGVYNFKEGSEVDENNQIRGLSSSIFNPELIDLVKKANGNLKDLFDNNNPLI